MDATVPFAQALTPFIAEAENRFRAAVPCLDRVLSRSAQDAMRLAIARDLAFVTTPTLLDLFLVYPERRRITSASTAAHDRFVESLSGLSEVLDRLPELARLIDQVMGTWRDRLRLLAARLEADEALLEERFAARLPFDTAMPVVDSAIVLGNGDSPRIVYKDRPSGMDAAWAELLMWVNACGPRIDLFVPQVVDRGEYGWMEYVPHRPPTEPARVFETMTRVGMLIGLAYALGGGDIHNDNVRFVAEHPVIIDAEVMLRPRRANTVDDDPSVIATCWLPTVREIDRCGLAAGVPLDRSRRWVDVGTDAIRQLPFRSPFAGPRPEVVEYFGRHWPQNAERLCSGFREIYKLIKGRGMPLDVFSECRPRVLLRTSSLYQETIEDSILPASLSSPAARSNVIERLVRDAPPTVVDLDDVAHAVAAVERESMDGLQVPRFTMRAGERRLLWKDRILGAPYRRSPLDRARSFIARMDRTRMEAHCREITEIIQAAANDSWIAEALRIHFPPGPSVLTADESSCGPPMGQEQPGPLT